MASRTVDFTDQQYKTVHKLWKQGLRDGEIAKQLGRKFNAKHVFWARYRNEWGTKSRKRGVTQEKLSPLPLQSNAGTLLGAKGSMPSKVRRVQSSGNEGSLKVTMQFGSGSPITLSTTSKRIKDAILVLTGA